MHALFILISTLKGNVLADTQVNVGCKVLENFLDFS